MTPGGRFRARLPRGVYRGVAVTLCGVAGVLVAPRAGLAGSARDYLTAPIDTWLTFYNFAYSRAVTPEDGLDVTSSVRTNILAQSLVATRTFGVWGRTTGISTVLPYVYLDTSSGDVRASNQGVSDIGMLFQVNTIRQGWRRVCLRVVMAYGWR